MARFDLELTDLKTCMADRVVADYFIEERRRASFLHRHFCGPGLLGGLDLADGVECGGIRPNDHAAFFLSHTLGPGRINSAPPVTITAADGVEEERRSFFRTTTRHLDDGGQCPFVAITFQNENSLHPSQVIVQASRALTDAGIDHAIERSFRIGRWTLWIFLQQPVCVEQAQAIARASKEAIVDAGVPADLLHLPVLAADPSPPIYLPYHFFCADYFGQLHSLDERNGLVPMNPNAIPLLSVPTSEPQVDCAAKSVKSASVASNGQSWEGVIRLWYDKFGEKRVRAGELAALLAASDCLPPEAPPSWQDSSQAAAIWLGKMLQTLVGKPIGEFQIKANRSGNSTAFRLGRSQSKANP